ncbi:cytochrome c biogenesis heme-transporting ATPase CcmA [Simiduia sp. 21SJ11W-1]|uniref:cytochrome c biogenesis heme-transporting ATPase CcmA n=1 Tax=Simiduia sp. 21SJ11W-1 TaxID=2909669 RepID=UPI00209E786D|nr:cytochrome c biogenesis heme-transporting ATPase CcmA [Simiduia sp. 21SJ11W-1]UTA46526.1 cytochrome c biogenesis heme-transporting ATPase CcmA [Simiduia sp. 21SJ11W-1]
MLALKDLSCERDNRMLFTGLSAEFGAGEVWHIEGPNGVGKTSLLRIITGVSRQHGGGLFWRGQPMAQQRYDFAQSLLYIGHLPAIKKALTAEENLQSLCPGATGGAIGKALAELGLYGFEEVPCYRLSAGQLRRVALARLALSDAAFWVLDEPFTALDVNAVSALEQRLQGHAAKGGCVVLTSHQRLSVPVNTLALGRYAQGGTL